MVNVEAQCDLAQRLAGCHTPQGLARLIRVSLRVALRAENERLHGELDALKCQGPT